MRFGTGAALVAAILTAGCAGSNGGGVLASSVGQLGPLLRGEGPKSASGAVSSEAAAPEAVAANPEMFMTMQVGSFGISELVQKVADNGAKETWAGPSGVTAAYNDGMLVATRGLIEDLLAADARESRAALRQGGGTARRVHESLDDLDRVVRSEFDCTIAPQGAETIDLGVRKAPARKYSETCLGSGLQFENLYWLDPQGDILASRQFVTRSVAYLRGNRL